MLEQIVAQRRVIISQMRVYYLSRLFPSLHLRFEDEVKLIKGLLQSELGEFIPRAYDYSYVDRGKSIKVLIQIIK